MYFLIRVVLIKISVATWSNSNTWIQYSQQLGSNYTKTWKLIFNFIIFCKMLFPQMATHSFVLCFQAWGGQQVAWPRHLGTVAFPAFRAGKPDKVSFSHVPQLAQVVPDVKSDEVLWLPTIDYWHTTIYKVYTTHKLAIYQLCTTYILSIYDLLLKYYLHTNYLPYATYTMFPPPNHRGGLPSNVTYLLRIYYLYTTYCLNYYLPHAIYTMFPPHQTTGGANIYILPYTT